MSIRSVASKNRLRALLLLGLLFALTFGVRTASALEVPDDAREVRVPVTLTATDAIAGGEIEFTLTEGLAFVDFLPASGIQNKMQTQVDGKQYAGFFAADNRYAPVNGSILMGHIVLVYTGTDTQEIHFSEVRLHTKVAAQKVDSATYDPDTTVRITRSASEGDGGDGDGGAGGGGAGGSGSGAGGSGDGAGVSNGAGAGAGTTGTPSPGPGYTQTVPLPGTGSTGPVVIDRSVGDTDDTVALQSGSGTTANGLSGADTSTIQDAATPLGANDAPAAAGFNPTLLLLAGLLALAAALSLFFLFRRRRRRESRERVR